MIELEDVGYLGKPPRFSQKEPVIPDDMCSVCDSLRGELSICRYCVYGGG